jgi:ribosomal protein S9
MKQDTRTSTTVHKEDTAYGRKKSARNKIHSTPNKENFKQNKRTTTRCFSAVMLQILKVTS